MRSPHWGATGAKVEFQKRNKRRFYVCEEFELIKKKVRWMLVLEIRMQLNSGAELFGNVIVPYSELTSKYHIGA
jgi:hypothetical protein